MAQKSMTPEATPTTKGMGQPGAAREWPPEVADLLGKAAKFLQEGQPEKALDLIARAKLTSPWATNALGVCQLRLGKATLAVDLFRGLVLAAGGLLLRPDVPAVFKTNYAAALIAADNLSGGLRVLEEIRDESNPAVQTLRAAVRRWEAGLTFWQKLNWWFGGQPDHPLVLDFPLGDLG